MENILRKGEIASNKQFLLSSHCILSYAPLIFLFKCTLKCCLQLVSNWTFGNGLTLSQTSPGFYLSPVKVFWKQKGKGEIACDEQFLLMPLSKVIQSYHEDSSHYSCLSRGLPVLGWRSEVSHAQGHSHKKPRGSSVTGDNPRIPGLWVKHFTTEPHRTTLWAWFAWVSKPWLSQQNDETVDRFVVIGWSICFSSEG